MERKGNKKQINYKGTSEEVSHTYRKTKLNFLAFCNIETIRIKADGDLRRDKIDPSRSKEKIKIKRKNGYAHIILQIFDSIGMSPYEMPQFTSRNFKHQRISFSCNSIFPNCFRIHCQQL